MICEYAAVGAALEAQMEATLEEMEAKEEIEIPDEEAITQVLNLQRSPSSNIK